MALSIQQIIDNSRSYEEAQRAFGVDYPSPSTSQGTEFMSKANRKFPLKSTTTTSLSKSGGFLDAASRLVSAGERQTSFPPEGEMVKLSSVVGGVGTMIDKLMKLDFKGAFAQIGETLGDQIITYYQQQSALIERINKQAGLTGQFAENVRDELTRANPELLLMGITFEELASSAKSVVSDSGRFLALNRDTWRDTGLAASAYVGSLEETVAMFPQFEKVGIGAGNVSKQIVDVGKRSIELGLQSQKTTKDLNTNLGKLNEYGFKNGVQGLAEMVRRSTELRMNMDTVFQVAEKVFEPDQAIDLAANLQAIGGAIGDFNDPLKLMYMATNGVEGLQDALVGVAGSLATYNQEQNRFEITGVNLRRARALAKELGISYNELANTAIASAERTSAAADLMATGLSLDEDQKRFLTNIATMKDGKMTIELQSNKLQEALGVTEVALEDLSQTQVKQLLDLQNEFKELSPEKIVQKQATDIENINRNLSFIAAVTRQRAIQSGEKALEMIASEFKIDIKKYIEKSEKVVQEMGRNALAPKGVEPKKTSIDQSNIQPKTKLREEDMKSSFDMYKRMYDTKEAQSSVKKVTQDFNVTIKSDTNGDPIARSFLNRPDIIDEFKNRMMDDKAYV